MWSQAGRLKDDLVADVQSRLLQRRKRAKISGATLARGGEAPGIGPAHLTRALHGVGNPWGPVCPTGNGWKWVNFQGKLWGGAVTGGKQGPHNISEFLRL